ncbi:threonine synthase [Candidatus Aenigmatarchaeota archaeon]
MYVKHLQCIFCGRKYNKNNVRFKCDCGESLDVVYNYNKIRKKLAWDILRKRFFGHWRYREFFPITKDENIITLGEGGTPLIGAGKIRGHRVFMKYEGMNPTGSFKDRGTTVEISKALELKTKIISCASTGNMGASISAYASRAGMTAKVFVPSNIRKAKVRQIEYYGGHLIHTKGHYAHAINKAMEISKRKKYFLMGDYPYRGEGEKSIAYEVIDQMDGKVDYIICPIGSGTLFSGVWKGLKEMKIAGLIKYMPKLIGVQAKGCSTVCKAFLKGENVIENVVPKTKASAIACGKPLDGYKALFSLYESDGYCVDVSDNEMEAAKRELATYGVYAELSAAAPLAGFRKMHDSIKRNSNIVLIVTGNGLKE